MNSKRSVSTAFAAAFLALAVTPVPGQDSTASPDGIVISNFLSGTLCARDDDTKEVCEQVVDIDVNGASTCIFNGEERRCTWYGFQFDYENANPGIPIKCDYWRSVPSTEGNPQGINRTNATTGTFSYDLESSNGHFYNPMYQLHAIPPNGGRLVVAMEMDCTAEAEKVFDMTFNFIFSIN